MCWCNLGSSIVLESLSPYQLSKKKEKKKSMLEMAEFINEGFLSLTFALNVIAMVPNLEVNSMTK